MTSPSSAASVMLARVRQHLIAALEQRAQNLSAEGIPGAMRYKVNGREYAYFRAPRQALPLPWGSPAFFKKYFEIVATLQGNKHSRSLSTHTIADVHKHYVKQLRYLKLPIATRNRYAAARRVLSPFEATDIREVDHAFALKLRDHARRSGGAAFANIFLSLLKEILEVAVRTDLIRSNPALGIRKLSHAMEQARYLRRKRKAQSVRDRVAHSTTVHEDNRQA